MPIKICPVFPKLENVPVDKLNQIFGWAKNKFWKSVESRSKEIDGDYRRWVDNYAAKPAQAIRTIPYYKASNFVPQLIRMHTDLLAANNVGLMFSTRPFWKPATFSNKPGANVLNALGEWMDTECKYNINFFDPVDLGIFLTVKTGLHVLKNCWVSETRDRADAEGNIKSFSRESLVIDNIPFDDLFPYPVTAQFFRDCTAIFHRLRFTKEEVEFRRHLPPPFGWPAGPASSVLMGSSTNQSTTSSARDSLANDAGYSLTPDVTRPFTVIEMWGSYELTPGKMADIVLTFNPFSGNGKDGIIRLWYNYLPGDLDPFVDLRIMPREGSIVGDCIPNILEQSQEEQAQIHNARRDKSNIVNVPGWKKKTSYTGANPSTEWYPGKVFEVDSMDDIEPLEFGGNYESMIEEENAVMALAERYSGVSSAKQGFGTGPVGKKGIYASQATLALLSEGNQRQDIYLQRLRRSFNKQGQLIFVHYRDFAKSADWSQYGENGDFLKQAFSIKDPEELRAVFFGLGASDAGANREVDRQNLLLMSNTMSAYYKEIMALAPQIAQMPPGSPAQELSLQVLDGARELSNRILFAFNVYDRKKLVPDVRELLGGGKPQSNPRALDQAGVPQPESSVSGPELQNLSDTVAQVTSAQRNGANGSIPGGSRPS
jgi:hypothetical protein